MSQLMNLGCMHPQLGNRTVPAPNIVAPITTIAARALDGSFGGTTWVVRHLWLGNPTLHLEVMAPRHGSFSRVPVQEEVPRMQEVAAPVVPAAVLPPAVAASVVAGSAPRGQPMLQEALRNEASHCHASV